MSVESVVQGVAKNARVRIAVDAMGGDHTPEAIVGGALQAAVELPVDIILVGDEPRLKALIQGKEGAERLTIQHASDVIAMGAHPVEAVRKQRDSSIVVATRLVKEGRRRTRWSAPAVPVRRWRAPCCNGGASRELSVLPSAPSCPPWTVRASCWTWAPKLTAVRRIWLSLL